MRFKKFFDRSIFVCACTLCGPALISCSSSSNNRENDPSWTRQPAREVDNGYIVYVESVDASDSHRARFLAEGQALMDLRNECTLIPKGARVEDQYEKTEGYKHEVFVKVAVEFQECEQGKRAITVDEIQKLANASMTEEVKRFEDEQKLPPASELAENGEGETGATASSSGDQMTHTQYLVMRENLAMQKQYVVLAPVYYSYSAPQSVAPVPAVPPQATAAGAPAQPVSPAGSAAAAPAGAHGPEVRPSMNPQEVNQRLAQQTAEVQRVEQSHPEFKTHAQTWTQARTQMVRAYRTQTRRNPNVRPVPHAPTSATPPAQRRRRRFH